MIGSTEDAPGSASDNGGGPVVSDARDVILSVLSTGNPPIGAIAGAINMSIRTLQRRLAASGRTYKDLVDEVRLAEAQRALAESDSPLKAIAFDLGFAEQASFTRAFRRWTGQAPSEYRKRQRRQAAEARAVPVTFPSGQVGSQSAA